MNSFHYFGKQNAVKLNTPNKKWHPNKFGHNKFKPTPSGSARSCFPKPHFSDVIILNRVSQYLQSLKRNAAIDFDQMADKFQTEYIEYRRRKRQPLKQQLRKAVDVLSYESRRNEEEEEDDDDDEVLEDDDEDDFSFKEVYDNGSGRDSPVYAIEGDGDVNSTLEDSYFEQNSKKRRLSDSNPQGGRTPSNPGNQELINIVSSDEDTVDTTAKAVEKKEPVSEDNQAKMHLISAIARYKEQSQEASRARTNLVFPAARGQVSAPLAQRENKTVVPAAATQSSKEPPLQPQTARKRRAPVAPIPGGSKRFKDSLEPVKPVTTFKDIGGNEKVLQDVTQLLVHMRHPEVYRVLGVSPPRGFLLHGPPGSGKTLFAHAIAGELKVPLLKVAAPELVGGLSGQSEERIRELFEQAVALAPCVLFIDEVDAITPHREMAHREMERRIVAQLLSSMDELSSSENGDRVLVIGATNRPDSLDPALRRAGRFDREVCLGIPDRESRLSILTTLCQKLRLAPDLQLSDVAVMTPGFVGADLKSLVTEAAMAAVNRLFKNLTESEKQSKDQKNSVEEPVKIIEEVKEKEENNQKKSEDKNSKEGNTEETKSTHENMDTSQSDEIQVIPEQGDEIEVIEVTKQAKADDTELPAQVADVTASADQEQTDEIQVIEESVHSKGGSGEPSVSIAKVAQSAQKLQESLVMSETVSLLHSAPLSVEQLQGVFITLEDFKAAFKNVQPSAKREGFATVPDVRWEDIGSLQDIRHELQMAILGPVKYPKEFAAMGLDSASGVLLCGPPGCGKTLLAKAVANEAGINFISVKGPELLNMYVGESERAVRQCFQRARSSQPCVIFFDEIDALCPKRTNMENGASRVVNQLLTEMDGVEARTGVFLMAATNRPDIVDPAVMRPGRLDKVLYVGLPNAEDRLDIMRAVTKGGKRPQLSEDVDLSLVVRDVRCEGYSGADLAALVREASLHALREYMGIPVEEQAPTSLILAARHFHTALDKIRPSVSERDKKRYEDLRLQYTVVPETG